MKLGAKAMGVAAGGVGWVMALSLPWLIARFAGNPLAIHPNG